VQLTRHNPAMRRYFFSRDKNVHPRTGFDSRRGKQMWGKPRVSEFSIYGKRIDDLAASPLRRSSNSNIVAPARLEPSCSEFHSGRNTGAALCGDCWYTPASAWEYRRLIPLIGQSHCSAVTKVLGGSRYSRQTRCPADELRSAAPYIRLHGPPAARRAKRLNGHHENASAVMNSGPMLLCCVWGSVVFTRVVSADRMTQVRAVVTSLQLFTGFNTGLVGSRANRVIAQTDLWPV